METVDDLEIAENMGIGRQLLPVRASGTAENITSGRANSICAGMGFRR
jgi:hypothetical protein